MMHSSWGLLPIFKSIFGFFFGILLSGFFYVAQGGAQETDYPEFIEEIYLTEKAALESVFPKAEEVRKRVWKISQESRDSIESRTGWSLAESSVTIHQGFQGGQPVGMSMIMEEIGKFKPITFIVKVGKNGKLEKVEVMVYRESVGSEVRRKRFSRQFKGKTAKSRLRINRDIINITGATMSVQAVTAGVKKALVIMDEAKKNWAQD